MIDIPKALDRKILFSKQVDQESIEKIVDSILKINDHDRTLEKLYKLINVDYKPEPIEIYIDSYGGSVYQIFGLLNIISNSKTKVHTIVTGCAMSCGFMLLISGHKRFAYKLSTGLYHSASWWAEGKVKDMEERVSETKRLQKIIEKVTLDRTKITKKQLKKNKKRKIDWFISSKDLLKLGIVDEII